MIETVFRACVDPVLAIRALCACVEPAMVHVPESELCSRAAFAAALAVAQAIEDNGDIEAARKVAKAAAAAVTYSDAAAHTAYAAAASHDTAKAEAAAAHDADAVNAYALAYAAAAAAYDAVTEAAARAAIAAAYADVAHADASLRRSANTIRERITWEMIGTPSC